MCKVLELTFDLRQGSQIANNFALVSGHLSCYVGELQVHVLSPGPLWFKGHGICFALYLVLTLLELCLAVQPAGSQPQGASECPDHVLPGSQLR